MMFVALANIIGKAIRNNDPSFFKDFTENRETLEKILLDNKALIGQANVQIRSQNRLSKWSDLLDGIARGRSLKSDFSQDDILEALGLSGKIIASEISEVGENFTDETKSAVFLRESIKSAYKCSVCNGLVLAEKSVSYDHITPKSRGGRGGLDNTQITHPYCNSIKEGLDKVSPSP